MATQTDTDRFDIDPGLAGKYGVLAVALIAIFFPLLWMLSTALKSDRALAEFPPPLLPRQPSFGPALQAVQTGPWAQWFLNTFIIAAGAVVMVLAVTVPTAYALARRDFFGKKGLYLGITAFLMLPPQILLLPLFIQFARLNLIGSYVGLILAYTVLFSAFVTFLLQGFFQTLPSDVEDAARVGGASELRIFLRIILPLAKPAIGVAAIFVFVFAWNEYLWALVFLQDQSMYTISIGLTFFEGNHGQIAMNQLMSMSVLASLPVLILFALTQERFIQGITTGYEF
ncbi:MAG: carbohydrate ABC transporter permease [Halobacteriales archaeon]